MEENLWIFYESVIRVANSNEKQANETEANIKALLDTLVANGRLRGEFKAEKTRDENTLAEISQNLDFMKREVAQCEAGARMLREQEKDLEEQVYRIEEEGEEAERQARIADEEANRLERELEESKEYNQNNTGNGGAGPSWK